MSGPLVGRIVFDVSIFVFTFYGLFHFAKRIGATLKARGYSLADMGYYLLKGMASGALLSFVVLLWRNGNAPVWLTLSCLILWLAFLAVRGFPYKKSIEERDELLAVFGCILVTYKDCAISFVLCGAHIGNCRTGFVPKKVDPMSQFLYTSPTPNVTPRSL